MKEKIPFKVAMIEGCEDLVPTRKSEEDSGYDLRSAIPCVVLAKSQLIVPCGFKMSIPQGYEGQVRPRSGLAAKHGITVLNSPGTIDAGYRGEIMAILSNHSQTSYEIKRGDRIAQIVIVELPSVELSVVKDSDLSQTDRGVGGFGSTGVK